MLTQCPHAYRSCVGRWHVGDGKQCEQFSPSLSGEPSNFPFFKQLTGQLNLVPYGMMGRRYILMTCTVTLSQLNCGNYHGLQFHLNIMYSMSVQQGKTHANCMMQITLRFRKNSWRILPGENSLMFYFSSANTYNTLPMVSKSRCHLADTLFLSS